MENKVCFLFGHGTAPQTVGADILSAAEKQYMQYHIRTFIVGNRGNFDRLAAAAIKVLKKRHGDITLLLLLSYPPFGRSADIPQDFDNAYYPPIEVIPLPYAIVGANQYMIDHADSIICYVNKVGNTRNLLEYASRRTHIPITNIAGGRDVK